MYAQKSHWYWNYRWYLCYLESTLAMVTSEASLVVNPIISRQLINQVDSLVACHAFLLSPCKGSHFCFQGYIFQLITNLWERSKELEGKRVTLCIIFFFISFLNQFSFTSFCLPLSDLVLQFDSLLLALPFINR